MNSAQGQARINIEEIERLILGSMILDPDTIHKAYAELTSADFSTDAHRAVFEAMAGFAEDGSDFDEVLLAQRIPAHRLPISPIAWISGLTEGLPRDRGANLQKHAAIIREEALRRRIIAHSERVRAMADRGADAAELFAAVRDIERLAEFDSNGNLLPASFAAKAGLKLIEGAMAEDVITEWLIPYLLPKGTLVGIIGQPGIGKTIASLRMCAEVSNTSGKPILFLSNEDSPGRIVSSFVRLGGNKASISSKIKIKRGCWIR